MTRFRVTHRRRWRVEGEPDGFGAVIRDDKTGRAFSVISEREEHWRMVLAALNRVFKRERDDGAGESRIEL